MRAGAGLAVGPLEQADTIGLDVVLETLNRLSAEHGENYKPSATLQGLVAKGALGKKTGRGFLEYAS
jgi:3-hydroxybutyryl-CoA dehydrogenase